MSNAKAIPFNKGDMVKFATGFPANVMNVIEGVAIIFDQDPNGNPGLYRLEAGDPEIDTITRLR